VEEECNILLYRFLNSKMAGMPAHPMTVAVLGSGTRETLLFVRA